MKIELRENDKTHSFRLPDHVPGRLFFMATKMIDDIETVKGYSQENVEKWAEFIVEAYGNRFDVDRFISGIDSRVMIPTFYATALEVIGNVEAALEVEKKQIATFQTAD